MTKKEQKRILKEQQRKQHITEILSYNKTCYCGYKYTEQDFVNIKILPKIEKIKNSKYLFLNHHKSCEKKYKHSLVIKPCIKCGKEISIYNSHDICDDCRHIEERTVTCNYCR